AVVPPADHDCVVARGKETPPAAFRSQDAGRPRAPTVSGEGLNPFPGKIKGRDRGPQRRFRIPNLRVDRPVPWLRVRPVSIGRADSAPAVTRLQARGPLES